eukprot:4278667-Heterocapsa_arctica.AAC.1
MAPVPNYYAAGPPVQEGQPQYVRIPRTPPDDPRYPLYTHGPPPEIRPEWERPARPPYCPDHYQGW